MPSIMVPGYQNPLYSQDFFVFFDKIDTVHDKRRSASKSSKKA